MTEKPPTCSAPDRAWPAAKWVPLLTAAGLIDGHVKTTHAFEIRAGKWLAARVKLGRAVPVEHGGRAGKAVLRVIAMRANEKRYYFDVTWDAPAAEGVAQKADPVPDAPDPLPAPPPAAPSPRPPAAGGNAEDWQ